MTARRPETWHEAVQAFTVHLAAAGRSTSTRKLRRWQLLTFADVAGVVPSRVTLPQMEAWLSNPDWSRNTRAAMRDALTTFFSWMTATGRRPDNPAVGLAPVGKIHGTPRPCPDSVLRTALMAAGPRERLMIALAAEAGCRRAEVAAARREDLEVGPGGAYLRIVGKGSRARLVPISDGLALMIRNQPPGWLFPSPQTSEHLTPAYVGQLVRAVLPDGWTTHTLRHRFASAAYAVDTDLRAVQELLGHASVATTQVYTAVPDGAKRRAVAGASLLSPPLAAAAAG